jgi:hypothetical protein
MKPKPVLDPRLFWDVDMSKLDYDQRAGFVIERVFDRGDVEDIRQVRRHYGDDLVRDVLLQAKYLQKQTLYLAAAIFQLDLSAFRCYKLNQSSPALSDYWGN